MFRLRALVLAVAVVFTVPAAAHAQQARASAPASASASAGPRLDLTTTAVHSTVSTTASAPATRKSLGQPVALMIVGGAAVLLGAIVGGDPGVIIMIGGAAAFLIGLYQYLE